MCVEITREMRKNKPTNFVLGKVAAAATFTFINETMNDMYLWLDCVIL